MRCIIQNVLAGVTAWTESGTVAVIAKESGLEFIRSTDRKHTGLQQLHSFHPVSYPDLNSAIPSAPFRRVVGSDRKICADIEDIF